MAAMHRGLLTGHIRARGGLACVISARVAPAQLPKPLSGLRNLTTGKYLVSGQIGGWFDAQVSAVRGADDPSDVTVWSLNRRAWGQSVRSNEAVRGSGLLPRFARRKRGPWLFHSPLYRDRCAALIWSPISRRLPIAPVHGPKLPAPVSSSPHRRRSSRRSSMSAGQPPPAPTARSCRRCPGPDQGPCHCRYRAHVSGRWPRRRSGSPL